MNKLLSKITASALAMTAAAVYLPFSDIAQTYAAGAQTIDAEQSLVALYAKSSLVLNEKSVNVRGSVYSGDKLAYKGNADKLSVSGTTASANDGTRCDIPDYTELINSMKAYDFEFEGSQEIYDSVLDLSTGSVYAANDIYIAHAELQGSGRISAGGDITMRIAGDDSLSQAFIMSEKGDITIDAANLDYTGIIYAPKGKVKINAKNIDLTGAIYAESVEINGTSLSVDHREFFSLNCRAHDSSVVHIHMNEELTLNGMVSNSSASVLYKASDMSAGKVTITNENTLHPTLSFSEEGEYDITLFAELREKKASDTVRVIVAEGPVVSYTTTEDFDNGSSESVNGADNELKLAEMRSDGAPSEKTFSIDGESGIAVTAKQNKTSISFGGDDLDLDYSLKGYGKLISGSGNDVVLCIDNSSSVSAMIPTIKESALQIIESMGPNDRLGLTSLDRMNTNLTDDKEALLDAFDKYKLGGGSDYGNGIKIAIDKMFDEASEGRDKYIFLLADGENFGNDDAVALEYAAIAREKGIKIYTFEINDFSSNFKDTQTVQQVAIDTNGAYKLCPDADAIKKFLLNIADSVYNLAARNVTFTTTVKNADWLRNGTMSKAPDSMEYNADGSVTLSWHYSTFEINAVEDIGISLDTGIITEKGSVQVTSDTMLISYDANGEGSVVYLDDIIVNRGDYAENGKWVSSVYDSGVEDCPWSYVKWTADHFGNSAIDVYLSTSSDGKAFSDRVKVTNGQEIELNGRYIRTEVELKASEDGKTPILYDLTIYSDPTDDPVEAKGADIVINGAHSVPAGAPVSLWLDAAGKNYEVAGIQWSIEGGETVSSDNGELTKTVIFPAEGEYTVSVSVECAGIITESSVKVTVLPQETLWQEVEDDQEEFSAVGMSLSEIPVYATDYREPIKFNILFENPEQVAWVRALYYTESYGALPRVAYIDEAEGYLVSVPLASTNLAETTITVEAYDWYGNMTSKTHTIKLDRTAPSVKVTGTKNWLYPDQEITLTVTASDNDELTSVIFTCNGDEIQLDDEMKYTFHGTEPGEYTFIAQACDVAGNVSESTYKVTVREDTGLPYLSVGGGSGVVLGNSIDLPITVYDNETSVAEFVLTVQKDGEENVTKVLSLSEADGFIEKNQSYTFTPESVGTYIFTATATDRAGNVRELTKKVNCTPDTSGPQVSISLSKTEILVGDSADVTVTVTDNVEVAGYKFYVNDVETEIGEDGIFHYTADDSDLDSKGTKYVTFKVVAVDTSGNERSGNVRLKVSQEDTAPPTITISSSNRFEYLSNGYMTIKATDNIGIESVEITVNGAPAEIDENNRLTIDTSQIGEHTVCVTATDTSGNVKTQEKTVVVSDTTRPEIKFTADKSSYTAGDSPVITVVITDNYMLGTVTATINDEEIETDNGSFTYTLSEALAGKYVITVRAEDIFGNTNEKSYIINVKEA